MRLHLLCCFCAALFTAQAQTIEFAPQGSVWEYQRQEGGWGPPVIDFVEVRYTENIMVDTIPCKRLVAPEGDYYVYQVGDRVYQRRDTGTQFKLLWDFGVMPGDSFLVYSDFYLQPNKKIKFVCTGRDTIWVNNTPLPRIDLEMYCGGSWVQPLTVNPRYGPMRKDHCAEYLFNTYYCLLDGPYGFYLLNYSESTDSTIVECPVTVSDPPSDKIVVSPNPTTGVFQLSTLPIGASTYCYDMLGQLVHLGDTSSDQVDLSAYPNGLYFLVVYQDGRPTYRKKVVKAD